LTEQVNNSETGSQTPTSDTDSRTSEQYWQDYWDHVHEYFPVQWDHDDCDGCGLCAYSHHGDDDDEQKWQVVDAFWDGWKDCPNDYMKEVLASSTQAVLYKKWNYERSTSDTWDALDLEMLTDEIVQDADDVLVPELRPLMYKKVHELLVKLSKM
jgi:hypothetical protein